MDAAPFLTVARRAEDLITEPVVADRWDEASALEGYTVGGLAGHLARAVLTVDRYLEQLVPDDPDLAPTDAAGYLVRTLAAHDAVASELHTQVRRRGEQEAQAGRDALLARLRVAREGLAARLAAADGSQLIRVLDDTVLPLEQYLRTRLVELVVHLDDLAVSVGRDGPDGVPPDAYATVAAVLARVAVARVGPLATVRSLARAERHPEAVRAL